jgi:hypothetical protein
VRRRQRCGGRGVEQGCRARVRGTQLRCWLQESRRVCGLKAVLLGCERQQAVGTRQVVAAAAKGAAKRVIPAAIGTSRPRGEEGYVLHPVLRRRGTHQLCLVMHVARRGAGEIEAAATRRHRFRLVRFLFLWNPALQLCVGPRRGAHSTRWHVENEQTDRLAAATSV